MTVLSDSFHKTMSEAVAEAARRRANPALKDVLTKVEPSPYGGFRVRSYPADLFIDQLADGPLSGSLNAFKHMAGF